MMVVSKLVAMFDSELRKSVRNMETKLVSYTASSLLISNPRQCYGLGRERLLRRKAQW